MNRGIVRKVDHVFVPVRDPEPLFTLFTETIGLPVAWPITDRGVYRSGAVCAGNANVEFITGDPALSPFFEPTEPLTVRGIAFEPDDGAVMASMLEERRLPHGEAGTVADDAGEPMFTNVFLSEMVADATLVFLCEYRGSTAIARRAAREAFAGGDGRRAAREAFAGGDGRRAAREAFAEGDGGPLGVRRLAEITLGLSDMDEADGRWQRFLAPIEPDAHGAYRLGDGPAIRLRRSPIDGVAALWLEVPSLAAARDALRERDLLGPMRASGIGLNYARTGGLDVWLSEKR